MRGRNLLFVTYGFPPARRAGCIRTWNIAKYLARAGWTVTVLTPHPTLHRTIDQPEKSAADLQQEHIRRLSTGHYWRWLASDSIHWPNRNLSWLLGGIGRRAARYLRVDPSIGWISPAKIACQSLTPQDVDLVLASGPPFSAFTLAKDLAEKFHCPYVLDYRDLWSRHLHNPVPHAARREASVLAGSAAVTVVSPSWGRVLERDFGAGDKLHVVSNGYDPEDLACVESRDFGHFSIVYTGSFWPPKRTISPIMAALQRLTESNRRPGRNWMFHYYGRHADHVHNEAQRFGITHRVIVNPMVPRAAALAVVKGAGAAVVITSVEENGSLEENGMITGKIFEAVGLGKPVLLVAPAASDAYRVIETTGLGRCFTAGNVHGIASFLDGLIDGRLLEARNPQAYAWGTLIEELDRILRSTVKD